MRWLRKFRRDQRGVAAVEMALILPFIAGFAVVSVGVWNVAMRKQDIRGPLKLAAQYYMNGGMDDAKAKTIAMSSWQDKPEGADIVFSRFCRCASNANACDTLCADSTPPSVFVKMVATATTPTAMFYATQTATEQLRVR